MKRINVCYGPIDVFLPSVPSSAVELVECCHQIRPFFALAELLEDGNGELESEEELCGSRTSLERQGHRGNTTVHVCWHRNTSVSMVDFSVAVEVLTRERERERID